jgi:hypothetical protein
MSSRGAVSGCLLVLTLCAACAPVQPRPRYPADAMQRVFVPATVEEAGIALDWHVARPTYLPSGAVLEGVEYSVRPEHQFVVQRYDLRGEILYILAQQGGPPAGGAPDALPARELTIHGRPAIVLGVPRQADGGVAEWIVLWQERGVEYVVGGPFAVEELIAVAVGLR